MIKYSKDGKVCFDPVKHTYKLQNRYLTGVTGLISRYKNKFDAETVATNYALKHGLDKDQLLLEWKIKGDEAIRHGSAVHKVFENYILTGEINLTGEYYKEQTAVKFINECFKTERVTPVDAEIIVYNECIASQIDCIVKNKKGEYFIFDWKTNDKIETNGYNKYMLSPFNLLPDASYYHYSLQLSFYKELYKDYHINGLYIIHIENDNYNFIKAENINIPKNILNEQRQHFQKT